MVLLSQKDPAALGFSIVQPQQHTLPASPAPETAAQSASPGPGSCCAWWPMAQGQQLPPALPGMALQWAFPRDTSLWAASLESFQEALWQLLKCGSPPGVSFLWHLRGRFPRRLCWPSTTWLLCEPASPAAVRLPTGLDLGPGGLFLGHSVSTLRVWQVLTSTIHVISTSLAFWLSNSSSLQSCYN